MRSKKKKQPTVVLDIDDTVSDFLGFLCYLYNNKNGTTVSVNDLTTWNFSSTMVEDAQGNVTKGKEIKKFFLEYESHGLYAALPPIKESVLAMDLIKRLGYKIVLLTARKEKYRKDTEINFSLYKIPYDEIIFDAEKTKHINSLARNHSIVAFADDKYIYVENVEKTDKVKTCFLINKIHNKDIQEPEGIVRINDLLEVVRLLPDVTQDK